MGHLKLSLWLTALQLPTLLLMYQQEPGTTRLSLLIIPVLVLGGLSILLGLWILSKYDTPILRGKEEVGTTQDYIRLLRSKRNSLVLTCILTILVSGVDAAIGLFMYGISASLGLTTLWIYGPLFILVGATNVMVASSGALGAAQQQYQEQIRN